MLYVDNPLDRPVVLQSFCGNSVQVPAKVRNAQVADKFGWQVPKGVRVRQGEPDAVDPTDVVAGEAPSEEMIRPPQNKGDAEKLANELAGLGAPKGE